MLAAAYARLLGFVPSVVWPGVSHGQSARTPAQFLEWRSSNPHPSHPALVPAQPWCRPGVVSYRRFDGPIILPYTAASVMNRWAQVYDAMTTDIRWDTPLPRTTTPPHLPTPCTHPSSDMPGESVHVRFNACLQLSLATVHMPKEVAGGSWQ